MLFILLYLFSNIYVCVCGYNLQFWGIKSTKSENKENITVLTEKERVILNNKLNDDYYLNTFKLKEPTI